MADKTGIEWTDATWNPIRGCSRVSAGCKNCYAERVAARFSGAGEPYHGLAIWKGEDRDPTWTGVVRMVPEHLEDPIRWKRPRRIFVNSMSDLFHEELTDAQIDQVFWVMELAERHTFQVLTKRPARMREYVTARVKRLGLETVKPHIWLGTSVEDQRAADERIPALIGTPASVRWLSVEPLLEAVDLSGRMMKRDPILGPWPLHWVVAGGESGPGARPMKPDWARSVRDQCITAEVPFLFKQWGEFGQSGRNSVKLGKKRAGRHLDGQLWDQYPEVRRGA